MNEIITHPDIWLGIIALNMTVIGLTSLAEKRIVVGVEYGKYLIDHYRIGGWLRLYYALVTFAIVNALSLLFMWWSHYPILQELMFTLLIISTWFLIYYFFWYVLRVNETVKREIYKNEILGMYIESRKECNFEGDRVVGMLTGDRTQKKISSNVQTYFNDFNDETIRAFGELFGPSSMLYEHTADVQSYWKQLHVGNPHDYRVYDDTDKPTGVNHISWEFFQMYRFSELQDKWLLEILNLFNKSYADRFPLLRLYNVARVLGQINKVGFAERLYHYKFLDYLTPFILQALDSSADDSKRRASVERYMLKQLAQYIFATIANKNKDVFVDSARKTLTALLTVEAFRGTISIRSRLTIFTDECHKDNKKGNILLKELQDYVEKQYAEIGNIVFDFGNVLVDWDPHYLYDKYIKDYEQCSRFLETVMTTEWLKHIDEGVPFDKCIEEAVEQHPEYEALIRLYKPHWQETITGAINGMEDVVKMAIQQRPVYGLSNWSDETFPEARRRHTILQAIDNYVISGKIKMAKPDSNIYQYFLKHFALTPASCLFIDDNQANVMAARRNGMKAICFKDSSQIQALIGDM